MLSKILSAEEEEWLGEGEGESWEEGLGGEEGERMLQAAEIRSRNSAD